VFGCNDSLGLSVHLEMAVTRQSGEYCSHKSCHGRHCYLSMLRITSQIFKIRGFHGRKRGLLSPDTGELSVSVLYFCVVKFRNPGKVIATSPVNLFSSHWSESS